MHARGDAAAVGDRPDDERLTTRRIAGGEDAGHRRRAGAIGDDVAARVEREAEGVDEPDPLRADEAHREEREIALELDLAAGQLADAAAGQLDPDRRQARDAAVRAAAEE